jgi:hypothetical protein
MALSRRQFFRRFVNPGARTPQDRLMRYATLDSYVRTHLLPYDFAVTDQQCEELYAEVRRTLEMLNDEELFSPEVYRTVDLVADGKLQPWREAYWLQQQSDSSEHRIDG